MTPAWHCEQAHLLVFEVSPGRYEWHAFGWCGWEPDLTWAKAAAERKAREVITSTASALGLHVTDPEAQIARMMAL